MIMGPAPSHIYKERSDVIITPEKMKDLMTTR
jgi:hypothetical protein